MTSNDDNDLHKKLETMNPSIATKIYGDQNKWNEAYKIAKLHERVLSLILHFNTVNIYIKKGNILML